MIALRLRGFVHTALLLTCSAAFATSADAGSWIVDANNGPGTNFTTLVAAEAAAADGDVIDLRAGVYRPITTSKALRIVGRPGAILRDQEGIFPPNFFPLRIENLPAGKEFSMKGVTWTWSGLRGAIEIDHCAGRVLLQRVEIRPPAGALLSGSQAAVTVVNSSQVTLSECTLEGVGRINLRPGEPALELLDSTAILNACTLLGGDSYFVGHGNVTSSPAVEMVRSELIASSSLLDGGSASPFGEPSSPGLCTVDSRVLLTGDATMRIHAGATSTGSAPAPALLGIGGEVLHDPNASFLPNPGAPPIAGTATIVLDRHPSLIATGAPLGGLLHTDLHSPQGEFLGLYFGPPAHRIPLGPAGDLWLDVQALFVIGFGVQDSGEHWINDLPVPSFPELFGWSVTIQASSGPIPGTVRFSTPGTVVLG